MDKEQNFFAFEVIFLKIVSMQPFNFFFLPLKLSFLSYMFNFIYGIFWHFIVIHLAIFQMQTIVMNLDKNLDEFIDYAMIGSIYAYGFLILCYWQFNSRKLSKLIDFIQKNFRQRSAKGKLRK